MNERAQDKQLGGKLLKFALPAAILFSLALTIAKGYLEKTIPLLIHPVVSLYLAQLQRSLIAIPVIVLLLGLLLVLNFNPERRLARILNSNRRWTRYLFLALFFVSLLLIAQFGYHRLPQGDGVGYSFQARIFALGHFSAPAPPESDFFRESRTVIANGKWFSYYSPGHALILLAGYLLGAAWLVGPVLGTLSLWFVYQAARNQYGESTARGTLLFGLVSPFLLFLMASWDAHVSALFFTALALYLVTLIEKGHRRIPSLLLGFSLGFMFLCRPYTGALVSAAILVYVLITKPRVLGYVALGVLPCIAFQLVYDKALMGRFFTLPYQALPSYHAIGFSQTYGGATYGMPGHSPVKALINLGYTLFALSLQLLGWPLASLGLFVASFFLAKERFHRLLLLLIAALVLGNFFYWNHGVTPYGPIYLSEGLPAFLILSSRGLIGINSLTLQPVTPETAQALKGITPKLLLFLTMFSLFVYIPFQFRYFQSGQWGETTKLMDLVNRSGIKKAIVFITGRPGHEMFLYTSGFIHNDPLLQADVLYAYDLGGRDHELKRYYPDREFYHYDAGSQTLSPFLEP